MRLLIPLLAIAVALCRMPAYESSYFDKSLAFPTPEPPFKRELAELKSALEKERRTVFCKPCNASGRIIEHGPFRSSNSECLKCRGAGRHQP